MCTQLHPNIFWCWAWPKAHKTVYSDQVCRPQSCTCLDPYWHIHNTTSNFPKHTRQSTCIIYADPNPAIIDQVVSNISWSSYSPSTHFATNSSFAQYAFCNYCLDPYSNVCTALPKHLLMLSMTKAHKTVYLDQVCRPQYFTCLDPYSDAYTALFQKSSDAEHEPKPARWHTWFRYADPTSVLPLILTPTRQGHRSTHSFPC